MKTPTKIAISAALLLGFCGLLAWLAPGRGTALAFVDLAEAFANIRTATCTTSSEIERPDSKITLSGKSMYLAPSGERAETTGPDGSTAITIIDRRKGKALVLSAEKKMGMVVKFENLPADRAGNEFEWLRKVVSDAQSGEADKVEPLGRQTIDGREVVGFWIPKADHEVKIWADPDTGLPVRVEFISHGKRKIRTVMSNFLVNVELDKSLFSVEVPEGYTVNQVTMDASEPTVDDLARTLRVVAEHNDGRFPAELLGVEGIEGVMFKAVYAKHGKGESPEKMKALAEAGVKVARGSGFVRNLAPENDYHYAGKDVMLDTPDRAIFWYKPDRSSSYQVIYADLSIKEVAPEDLPKQP